MNDILYCELCRSKLPPGGNHAVQGRLLCDGCMEDHTVICSRCGDRIMDDDNAGDGSTPLCEPCYERFYTRCDDCGRVIDLDHSYYHDDDDEPLCWRCYESRQIRDSVIEDYSYKPEPIFHGKGPRYFGLELEIDSGGDNGHHASLILDQANRNGLETMYAKHDSSINNGFELVTHPLSFNYHTSPTQESQK